MTSGDALSAFGGAVLPAFFGDSAMIAVLSLSEVDLLLLILSLTMNLGFAAIFGVVCGDGASGRGARDGRLRASGASLTAVSRLSGVGASVR